MTVQRERQRLLIVAALVLVLVLAGCTGQPSDQSSSKEKLKVGAILPLSGPAAVHGNSVKNAMELALEEEKNIEVVYSDSQAKPSQGLSAYEKMTTVDNVDVVFALFSRVARPLISKAKKDEIPLFVSVSTAAGFANKSKYVYRLYFTARQQGRAPFKAGAVEENDRIAVLYVQDEYGTSVRNTIRSAAAEKNVAIVEEEAYKPKATDYRTQLTKIKQADPEKLLFVAPTPQFATRIVKQVRELGIKAELVEPNILLTTLRGKLGKQIEGSYSLAMPFMIKETGDDFRQKYKKKYGKDAFFNAPFGYDFIKILSQATNGKSLSGSKIIQNIRNIETFQSLNGKVEVQKNGEINPPLVPVRIVNGSLQRVE